jgi:outer membrane lipoprotein LolB
MWWVAVSIRIVFGALVAAVVLAGCAGTRPVSPEARTSAASRALYDLKAWSMEGRIGVQTGDDAWQANLFWDHDAAQDRLRISGPLSQGVVSIVVQKDLIYVNEGNGRTQLSRDPDAMLRERLGFAVPLASLRYWILGVPDPGPAYSPMPGGEGAESVFRQLGWEVRLEQSQPVGPRSLPQKLRVRGSGVTLKIVADDWNIKG